MSHMSFCCPIQRPLFANRGFQDHSKKIVSVRGAKRFVWRGTRRAAASQDDSTTALSTEAYQLYHRLKDTSGFGDKGPQDLEDPMKTTASLSTHQGKKTWEEVNLAYKASLEDLAAAASRAKDALVTLTSHPDVQAERASHVLSSLYGFPPEEYPRLHAAFQENLQSFDTEEQIEDQRDSWCGVRYVCYEWSGKKVEWRWAQGDNSKVDDIDLEEDHDDLKIDFWDKDGPKPEGKLLEALGEVPGHLWPMCLYQSGVYPGGLRHLSEVFVDL